MRVTRLATAAVVATILAAPMARACEPIVAECLPRVVVYPSYTPDGLLIGSVEAPVRRPAALQASPVTGQPLNVIYNNPGRIPGSVEPWVELQRLPDVRHFKTRAVYPKGY